MKVAPGRGMQVLYSTLLPEAIAINPAADTSDPPNSAKGTAQKPCRKSIILFFAATASIMVALAIGLGLVLSLKQGGRDNKSDPARQPLVSTIKILSRYALYSHHRKELLNL